jgi:hypothetical protein
VGLLQPGEGPDSVPGEEGAVSLNRLGGALILSLLLAGCSDTREAKLRRAIQCREFADKDLANLKTELASEKVSVSLQESFYSDSRLSCISVFDRARFLPMGRLPTHILFTTQSATDS